MITLLKEDRKVENYHQICELINLLNDLNDHLYHPPKLLQHHAIKYSDLQQFFEKQQFFHELAQINPILKKLK